MSYVTQIIVNIRPVQRLAFQWMVQRLFHCHASRCHASPAWYWHASHWHRVTWPLISSYYKGSSYIFLDLVCPKGPSTLATLFNHMWPRFCGGDIYSRRKPLFSSFGEHTAVCGSSVRQAVARPRHRQSVCIYNIHVAATCRPSVLGSATKTRPHVVEQSGQCTRALSVLNP